jgi:hypothetical protein
MDLALHGPLILVTPAPHYYGLTQHKNKESERGWKAKRQGVPTPLQMFRTKLSALASYYSIPHLSRQELLFFGGYLNCIFCDRHMVHLGMVFLGIKLKHTTTGPCCVGVHGSSFPETIVGDKGHIGSQLVQGFNSLEISKRNFQNVYSREGHWTGSPRFLQCYSSWPGHYRKGQEPTENF